jgi:hypothetical protein
MDSGIAHCAFDYAADVSDVLPRGELRNDATPFAMNRHLRRDHVRPDGPRPGNIAGFLNDSGRCFIARGFDAENAHGRLTQSVDAPLRRSRLFKSPDAPHAFRSDSM